MAKLTGKKKAAFLRRMNKGRIKAGLKKIGSKAARLTKSDKRAQKKNVKRRALALRRIASRIKSARRLNRSIGRRKSQPIKRRKRSNNPVAKKKRAVSRSRGIFDKITKNKFVKGAALGLGGGALAIQISDRFAPQFSGIAQPLGAFVFGGPIGLVASVLLQGGLGFLTGGSQTANGGSRDTL